ncbi:MAG: putative MAP kinase kinase family domain protein [Streblomastix strix]|uniref:non-specific serine/threonine protein kinase n=1 Tax=Streblomastix strix TaxID=222440 RepID=A0A5J4WT46_9EUKA|nr:MAG: putative MAP kinase kinase family domain protein [Streblomastix strix]
MEKSNPQQITSSSRVCEEKQDIADAVEQDSQFFEVIENFAGKENDKQFISVCKGEIDRVIKKEFEYFTVERDGENRLIPIQYLSAEATEYTANLNLPNLIIQTKPSSSSSDTQDQDILSQCSTAQQSMGIDSTASSLISDLIDEPIYDDFIIVKKLFGGVMGKTYLVRLKSTGKLYVMKRVDYLDEKDKKNADDEVELMRRLTSRFTVRLIWTFTYQTDLYLITEYCERGDLRKVIKELQQLPEKERIEHVWAIFSHVILALNFIHSKGVIHRDIKPENIFIMKDGSARLGDFGLSKQLLEDGYQTVAGTRSLDDEQDVPGN